MMITEVLLIVLPILLGGLACILVMKVGFLNFLKFPLDFGFSLGGKRILGNNKTFLVPIIMIVTVLATGTVLSRLLAIDVPTGSYVYIGLFYSLGELPNSFIKRRLGIEPGGIAQNGKRKAIFFWLDNLDSLIGSMLGYILFFKFSTQALIVSLIIGSILHFSTDFLMKMLTLKK